MLIFTDDVQVQLSRHLLRTVCTDIANQAVGLLAADHMLTINDESALSPEVGQCKESYQTSSSTLNYGSCGNGR